MTVDYLTDDIERHLPPAVCRPFDWDNNDGEMTCYIHRTTQFPVGTACPFITSQPESNQP